MKKFSFPGIQQMVHLFFKLHPLLKLPDDNINMSQDSQINNITTVQSIKQAVINTDVPLTSKENIKHRSDIEHECNTICRESTEQDQPKENPKF